MKPACESTYSHKKDKKLVWVKTTVSHKHKPAQEKNLQAHTNTNEPRSQTFSLT
jgi:hypothetical protein